MARMGGSDELVAFGQTYGDFTPPTKSFELGIERGTILLAKNEVTKWCFGNACMQMDNLGREMCVKPKGQHSKRIDGAVALIIAYKILEDKADSYTLLNEE